MAFFPCNPLLLWGARSLLLWVSMINMHALRKKSSFRINAGGIEEVDQIYSEFRKTAGWLIPRAVKLDCHVSKGGKFGFQETQSGDTVAPY